MTQNPLRSHQRQVHLDFHTSPLIGDVASGFDPSAKGRLLLEVPGFFPAKSR